LGRGHQNQRRELGSARAPPSLKSFPAKPSSLFFLDLDTPDLLQPCTLLKKLRGDLEQ
jgi:hypothetical protein